jgi:uncharacterized protein YacL
VISEAVRLVITLATTAIGFVVGRAVPDWFEGSQVDPDVAIVTGAVLGAGLGYVVGGFVGRLVSRGLDRAPDLVSQASGPELFAGAFGVVSGVVVGVVVGIPLILLLPEVLGWGLAALVVLVLASFGARVFSARADDLLATAGLSVRPSKPAAGGVYLIDSSAAIDGRILELARAGLLVGSVWLPEFVIDELQGIADSGSKHTRRRGRRGLDVLDALRDVGGIDVRVTDDSVPEHPDVDAKLIALCSRHGATLVSTDHNLVKAAGLRGVTVLNPHALGELLRPALVPGDRVALLVERPGSEPGQGVGYTDDGTMVVVEGGAGAVGSVVEVEVANTLRTSVGRMLFARVVE